VGAWVTGVADGKWGDRNGTVCRDCGAGTEGSVVMVSGGVASAVGMGRSKMIDWLGSIVGMLTERLAIEAAKPSIALKIEAYIVEPKGIWF